MTLHPMLARMLAAPSDHAAPSSVEERRRGFAAGLAAIDRPGPVMASERWLLIDGGQEALPARLFRPGNLDSGPWPLLVFLHGGGWVQGSIETHASLCRYLAHHGRMLVLSADYRLAPEHAFPAPVYDAAAAIRWAVAHAAELGASPDRIIAGGDSAGGNLAAAACIMLVEEKSTPLEALLLLYPALDLASSTGSRQAFRKGYWLDTLDELIATYVPDAADRTHVLASPGRSPSLAGFPPTMIVTAGYDPLRDEAVAFAARLVTEGRGCLLLHEPSMIHGFLSLHGLLDHAEKALANIGAHLRSFVY